MKKNYVSPQLFIDEYVADTMIASCLREGNYCIQGQEYLCYACREGANIEGDTECSEYIPC